MYCPSCGNEIAVELKFCNRCGANLSLPVANTQLVQVPPVKLAVPSIVLGATIILGLLIITAGAAQMSIVGVPAVAVVWMCLFGAATLFGCTTMMIRFWTKLISLQREAISAPQLTRTPIQSIVERPAPPQLSPRFDSVPSVTENTTRTFSPVYTEMSDRGTKEY
jgi:hypothetical protein